MCQYEAVGEKGQWGRLERMVQHKFMYMYLRELLGWVRAM